MGGSYRVEQADDTLLPACFALLPTLAMPEAVVMAARDGAGVLLGAGAVAWRLWDDPPGMPAWIEVLPDARRRGVGRALLAALADAGAAEADRLWAARPIDEGSPAAAFATACGARPVHRQLYFETHGLPAFTATMSALGERLAASGRGSSALEVRAITAVDPAQVSALLLEGLNTPPPHLDAMLASARTDPPATARIDRERSFALVDAAGQVVGALLSRRIEADAASEVTANVVDPRWQRGAANLLLLRAFSQSALAGGCRVIRFDCDERVRDTVGIARRSGAERVRTATRYAYATAAVAG